MQDPVTGEIIQWIPGQRPRKWVMGHKLGYEYRHLQRAYIEGRITKEQFLEYFNNPRYYRPETSEIGAKHAHESDVPLYDFDN